MCNKEYILSPLLTRSSWKYIQNFAIINGEGERDLMERQLVVEVVAGEAGWGRGGRQHLGRISGHVTGISSSAPPCLHSCASARPAGRCRTSPKATVGPPWYSPPATATSGARRDSWCSADEGGRGAAGSVGRSGRWCTRRAAAGGDKSNVVRLGFLDGGTD
jgi:hypothetical protein